MSDDRHGGADGRALRRESLDTDAIGTTGNGTRRRPGKAATARRIRAIATIARRRDADLDCLLRDGYGVDRPEDLSLADASTLIDRMNATAHR